MYSFESSPSRKPLHAMVIAAFAAAAVLFSLSNVRGIPYPVIFQTGAILCLVAAVYLIARFSVKLYRYSVEPNGIVDTHGVEQCDLVVTEITGKKIKVVARIGLRDIDEVVVVRRKDKEAREAIKNSLCRDKQLFRCTNTPAMDEECYISIPEENSVLLIPADERMTAILRESSSHGPAFS